MSSLAELIERAEAWRGQDPDPSTVEELAGLIAARDEAELADRFAGRLQFGTAGLRGLLGSGPNRMNRAVVRQTTAGLARYLLEVAPEAASRGVVVGRDARRGSDVFAEDVAGVLAGHGVPALVLPEPAPTPVGAFALLDQRAAAAVVVTASHNPPEYNGYKVYWSNGAQIVPPHDSGIAAAIEAVGPAREVPLLEADAARARGLRRELGKDVGRRYLDGLLALRRRPGVGTDLPIVYTPLHGVGGSWVTRVLGEAGFGSLRVVEAQQVPDGDFPTVRFPNPEEPGALDLAKALADESGAELVLANDPDADRLAAMVRDPAGALRLLSGDEIGVLLGHYLLSQTTSGEATPLVVTTIVSSQQLGAIARSRGARYEETLTGFRWVWNRALEVEAAEAARFLFGYEEALGYCVGLVRDKDGVGAALLFAELAGWCRSEGRGVLDYLSEIRRQHGVYLSAQRSFTFAGSEGARLIESVLEGFRHRPPAAVAGQAVARWLDYASGESRQGGVSQAIELPRSNVIALVLEDGARITLRPSGTEPKIKYYFEVLATPAPGESLEAARARGSERLLEVIEAFLALARDRGQPQ